MTTPVTLYGTQSNGETLPVQVNQFGQLVAEGLQGSEGPAGPPGDPGQDGGSFPLPPDPYEGALLGWLNGGLAWIGTPPVELPEGVFGPIEEILDTNAMVVTGLPQDLGTGVYLHQVDETGAIYNPGYLGGPTWSDSVDLRGYGINGGAIANLFDGNDVSYLRMETKSDYYLINLSDPRLADKAIQIYTHANDIADKYFELNGARTNMPSAGDAWVWVSLGNAASDGTAVIKVAQGLAGKTKVAGIKAGGEQLLDPEFNVQARSQSVAGETLIYSKVGLGEFEVGAYLKLPAQRVAPWVYYGDDLKALLGPSNNDREL